MAKKKQIHASHRVDIRDEYDEFNKDEYRVSDDNVRRVMDMRSAFYGGIDPRRRKEMSEGGMVREDRNQIANLSDRFVHKEYPRAGYYSNPYLDDEIECDNMVKDDNDRVYGG